MARAVSLALTAMTGLVSANLFAAQVENPYAATANGNHHRHGAFLTREAHAKMKAWARANVVRATTATTPGVSEETLSYGGGIDGIGVTSGMPKVYLVVYGSQWGTASTNSSGNMTLSGDTVGAVPYLESLFKGLGTGGEQWSGTMTQYCDGTNVATGATSCPTPTTPGSVSHVGYPIGGAFAGIWYDNSSTSPSSATAAQLASEAIKAAAHFGNTTAASNRYVQYVILSPTGTTPDGFNTSSGNFCAWHDYNTDAGVSSPYGDIAFTNMPYVYDAGSSCGASLVNSGSQGNLDGFSIVEGHEYAETITDQNPAGGWTNVQGGTHNGQETGDECAWITTGAQEATQNVLLSTGTFAMQSTWSNDTNDCNISHYIYVGEGPPPPPPPPPPGNVLINGVPLTGLAESKAGQDMMFSIVVPAGKSTLTFKTSGTIGDADIYAAFGRLPTDYSYDKFSDNYGDYETITFKSPKAGTYYLLLEAYQPFSGVTLTGTYK
jgi:serine protease